MRELIYLSERKMRQFLPKPRLLWARPKMTLTAPGASLDLASESDPERSRLKHLERITRHLERNAAWYADPDLVPGQWVAFEARMNYLVPERFPDCLLFADVPTRADDEPNTDVRLVLHGSSQHLLTGTAAPIAVPDLQAGARQIETVARSEGGFDTSGGPTYVSYVHRINTIDILLGDTFNRTADVSPTSELWRPANGITLSPVNLAAATARLVRNIDAQLPRETAARVAGYARITANLTEPESRAGAPVRYVVASPLYVQYAPQLPITTTRGGAGA